MCSSSSAMPGVSLFPLESKRFPAGSSGSALARLLQRAGVVVILLALLLPHITEGVVILKTLSERIITTRYGKIRGILVEFPNRHLKTVEAYRGLRYADLDGRTMRFMPPQNPKEQWNKVRVAFHYQPVCPQPMRAPQREYSQQEAPGEDRLTQLRNISHYVKEMKEDCLSLNLYVPVSGWNDTVPKAVMVFIHGESYDTGTGNAYDGSVLSSFGDVIVVTLNYRLGVLGFLRTEDNSGLGNQALMDISQALIWLGQNIASFNGDPRRVTLLGHGYGSAIVNLLMLSPFVMEGEGNLFQRAILQSGSALATWAMSYDPTWCSQRLALSVNCSRHVGDPRALVECLRERSFEDLVNAPSPEPKYYSCFAPSIDKYSILPDEVRKLLMEKKSKFAQVPVMFGITRNEAYAYLKPQEIRQGLTDTRKAQILRSYVQNVFRYHRQKIYEILDHHYTDWSHSSDPMTNRDNVLELLSDGQFVAPLVEMADFHAEKADTYLYSFSHSTQSLSVGQGENVQGIQGDELPYVFGSPLVDGSAPFPSSFTNTEKMLSEAVMTYWTNFAKTGNPNLPRNQTSVHGDKVTNRFIGVKWPKYEKSSKKYLSISKRPLVKHHYRAEKLALWLDLIPKIDKDDGSGGSSHLLDNSENASTFDDYSRLLSPNPDSTLFPSPPPMPPVRPTPGNRGNAADGGLTTQGRGYPGVTDQGGGVGPHGGRLSGGKRGGDNTQHGSSMHSSGSDGKGGDGATSDGAGGLGVTGESASGNSVSGDTASSGVPLSMVVAIGGSLLLINVLIFAGLCYQRERIRKMRRLEKPVMSPPELDYEDEDRAGGLAPANHHNSEKLLAGAGSAQGSPVCGGRRTNASLTSAGPAPECMSLISAGDSSQGGSHHLHSHHHHHRGPSPLRNNGYRHGISHVHNPSPNPFSDDGKDVEGGGAVGPAGRRNLPYMSRVTPPPLASIESSGSSAVGGGGSGFLPVTSGGYSAVPTHASSPVHRTHTGLSHIYSGVGVGANSAVGGGGVSVASPGSGGGGGGGSGTYVSSPTRPAPSYDELNHKPADIHSHVLPTGYPAGTSIVPTGGGGDPGVARSSVAMTTFGVGAGGGAANLGRSNSACTGSSDEGGSTKGSIGGGPPGSLGAAYPGDSLAATSTDPVYKKINKSGQNNAVTIV